MAQARARSLMLLVLLVASVALVLLAFLLLSGAREAAPSVARPAPEQGAFGVRPAGSDPARRTDEDQAVAGPPAEVASLPAAPAELVAQRDERPTDAVVSQPIVPSAETLAQDEAIAAVMPAVQKAVEARIEAQRRAIRNACWKRGNGESASLPIEASFAADGGLLALSISDDRAAPEVGTCVRAQPLPLAIEAPGVGVTVRVALTLP